MFHTIAPSRVIVLHMIKPKYFQIVDLQFGLFTRDISLDLVKAPCYSDAIFPYSDVNGKPEDINKPKCKICHRLLM